MHIAVVVVPALLWSCRVRSKVTMAVPPRTCMQVLGGIATVTDMVIFDAGFATVVARAMHLSVALALQVHDCLAVMHVIMLFLLYVY